MTSAQHALAQIAKRLQAPATAPVPPWSAPSMRDLIARIEAASADRRAS